MNKVFDTVDHNIVQWNGHWTVYIIYTKYSIYLTASIKVDKINFQ